MFASISFFLAICTSWVPHSMAGRSDGLSWIVKKWPSSTTPTNPNENHAAVHIFRYVPFQFCICFWIEEHLFASDILAYRLYWLSFIFADNRWGVFGPFEYIKKWSAALHIHSENETAQLPSSGGLRLSRTHLDRCYYYWCSREYWLLKRNRNERRVLVFFC